MDYSIPWQMENKSSHRSKSHKGEGGQEGAKGNVVPTHSRASLG